jgi:hypothetical protein
MNSLGRLNAGAGFDLDFHTDHLRTWVVTIQAAAGVLGFPLIALWIPVRTEIPLLRMVQM